MSVGNREFVISNPGSSLGLTSPRHSTFNIGGHWQASKDLKNLTACLLIAAVSWSQTKCSHNQAYPLPGVGDVHRSWSSTGGETGRLGSESWLPSKNKITELETH